MNEQPSEKYLRTRKSRLLLPVAIVPITAFFFWLSGGGTVVATEPNKKSGLNTQLPGARSSKDSAKDKMSFYASADFDSSKRSEALRNDPYRKDTVQIKTDKKPSTFVYAHSNTETEAITNKIAAIQRRIATTNNTEQVYRENKTVQALPVQKSAAPSPDPEMEAINATLDKLAAIQHPKNNSEVSGILNQARYSVSEDKETDASYFGKRKESNTGSAFYSDGNKVNQLTGLSATIASEQELQNGATVRLELGSPITVNGIRIPVGTAVYGIAKIETERLHILITSIRYGNIILPVVLTVYDMDGLEGIYVPGSMTRDVAKESAENAIQSTGIAGYGLSLSTQAAAAGIGAAKSLLSKKVKQVRVTIAAGYKVLLRDNKQMAN
ncbi:MAG: conjugative transposon protein TraM [Bacteroidota bacterium]